MFIKVSNMFIAIVLYLMDYHCKNFIKEEDYMGFEPIIVGGFKRKKRKRKMKKKERRLEVEYPWKYFSREYLLKPVKEFFDQGW